MGELQPEELEELVQELDGESDAEEPLSPEVEELLRDLQQTRMWMTRLKAAKDLGELSESSPRIVQSLIAAGESDSSPGVREAAMESLRTPAHQEILREYPDLMQHARSAAEQAATQREEQSEKQKTLTPEVVDMLRDLQQASLWVTRKSAAERLGELRESSPRVVQSLIVAGKSDSNFSVREAAVASLRAPVHQEILQEYPHLMQRAESAMEQAATRREGTGIIPPPQADRVGWSFWLLWVLASAAGLWIGAALDTFLTIDVHLLLAGGTTGIQGGFALWVGLAVGTGQWLLLRKRLDNAGWWILASIPFLIVGQMGRLAIFQPHFVLWGIGTNYAFLAMDQLVHFRGLAVGLAQWLILRRQIPRAGWWILICVLAWSIGVAVYNAVTIESGWFVGNFLAGIFVGAITGAGLVWLLWFE